MSSKSSRRTRKWSRTEQMNADLLIFLWAWVSLYAPTVGEILAVKNEILNVAESVKTGQVTLAMINRQLQDEFDLVTDWTRRDRS